MVSLPGVGTYCKPRAKKEAHAGVIRLIRSATLGGYKIREQDAKRAVEGLELHAQNTRKADPRLVGIGSSCYFYLLKNELPPVTHHSQ